MRARAIGNGTTFFDHGLFPPPPRRTIDPAAPRRLGMKCCAWLLLGTDPEGTALGQGRPF